MGGGAMPVRVFAVLSLLLLLGCRETVRHEGFAMAGPDAFLYSAHTNTVMTANDDGQAERLRRDWIVDALRFHGMCPDGYVIDTRRFVPDAIGPFGNGGDILYSGRCSVPPPPTIVERKQEEVFEK
jgi:hypothetical protein